MKFFFKRDISVESPLHPEQKLPKEKEERIPDQEKKTEESPSAEMDPASPETIRIIEPGMYDLNLLKLAESDDRVIHLSEDQSFRLDLLSMGITKKKK